MRVFGADKFTQCRQDTLGHGAIACDSGCRLGESFGVVILVCLELGFPLCKYINIKCLMCSQDSPLPLVVTGFP